MLACAIGDMEGGVVISQDVPNTFFRTSFPSDPSGKICISRIRGLIVDWLVDMNPSTYKGKFLCKKGQKGLYLEVLKEIYRMLVDSILWYRKVKKDLESVGFEFNPYEPCVANGKVNGKQQILRFHVDDMLVSHMAPKVNDYLSAWSQKKYGRLKHVEVTWSGKYIFLASF